MEHISNIKYIMPAEHYISQIPDYETFGRQTKLCLNPHNIPDLSWKWAEMVHTQDICHATGVEEDPKVTQDIRCLR